MTTHDAENIGTGFIVTDDGIICTCYHVIGDLQEQEIYKDIKIYFPSTKQTVSGNILLKDNILNRLSSNGMSYERSLSWSSTLS